MNNLLTRVVYYIKQIQFLF